MRTAGVPMLRPGQRLSRLDLSPYAADQPPMSDPGIDVGRIALAEATALSKFQLSDKVNTRMINDLIAMVTVEEDHEDDLVITEHPVEFGAAITDHAYKRPSEVKVRVGWSQSSGVSRLGEQRINDVREIYEKVLALQNSRNPFTLWTGKRIYQNMLVASIRVHTDARFEFTFMADIQLKEILLVSTQTITGANNAAAQAQPEVNSPVPPTGDRATTETNKTSDQITDAGATPPDAKPTYDYSLTA
jgi:hypothetical protein